MKARFPVWLWVLLGVWHLAIAIPFWRYSQPAPFFPVHGDLYRGWPYIYGLDQGDVVGDEWLFWVTYFAPVEFLLDTALAILCGLPLSIGAMSAWWWYSKNAATRRSKLA
jgi:hypothetical protein